MGRPRKEPDEPDEKTTGKTTTVTYNGPDGQVVTGVGELVSGESYELPEELAKSLVESSAFWEK